MLVGLQCFIIICVQAIAKTIQAMGVDSHHSLLNEFLVLWHYLINSFKIIIVVIFACVII